MRDTTVLMEETELIDVSDDGRCWFRCVAACGLQIIRGTSRNRFGKPTEKGVWELETAMADKIRGEVVNFLKSQKHIIAEFQTTLPFLLDREVGESYASIDNRITRMSSSAEYAGHLEILAVAYLTKTPVHIYECRDSRYVLTMKVPPTAFTDRIPISVLHKRDTASQGGHFSLLHMKKHNSPICLSTDSDGSVFRLCTENTSSSDGTDSLDVQFRNLIDPSAPYNSVQLLSTGVRPSDTSRVGLRRDQPTTPSPAQLSPPSGERMSQPTPTTSQSSTPSGVRMSQPTPTTSQSSTPSGVRMSQPTPTTSQSSSQATTGEIAKDKGTVMIYLNI
jgi:hypothetical protein